MGDTEYEGLFKGCKNPNRLLLIMGFVSLIAGIALQYFGVTNG